MQGIDQLRAVAFQAISEIYSCAVEDGVPVPDSSGAYFILQKQECLYIGRSSHLRKRIHLGHPVLRKLRTEKGIRIAWLLSPSPFLMERRYIKLLRPVLNKRPPAGRMWTNDFLRDPWLPLLRPGEIESALPSRILTPVQRAMETWFDAHPDHTWNELWAAVLRESGEYYHPSRLRAVYEDNRPLNFKLKKTQSLCRVLGVTWEEISEPLD